MVTLTVPQYDSVILQDRVAYPVSEDDARELATALTGRECDPLDWESLGELVFAIGDEIYHATFAFAGEWSDPSRAYNYHVPMLVAVTSVHVARVGGPCS